MNSFADSEGENQRILAKVLGCAIALVGIGGDRPGDKFSRMTGWRWAQGNRNYSPFIYNALKASF